MSNVNEDLEKTPKQLLLLLFNLTIRGETNQFYYPQTLKEGFIFALLIVILFFCSAKLWLSNL